jgi:hypothetical protein
MSETPPEKQNWENWIVPKTVMEYLAAAHCPLKRLTWLFDWTTKNPDKTVELTETLRQLDDEGKKLFFRALTYRHPQGKTKDPLKCATRILKGRRLEWHMKDVRRYYRAHKQKTLLLSNGLECKITATTVYFRPVWYALFSCAETQLKCELHLKQLVFLEDNAARSAKTLKHLRPLNIRYLKDGKWQFLVDDRYYAAITAIAENVPLEIATLLSE